MFLDGGKKEESLIIPYDMVYETAKQGIMALEISQKRIEKLPGKRKIVGASIIQMKLLKKIDLKKEYWSQPTNKEMWRYRLSRYNNFMKNPDLYQFLILPRGYNEKTKECRLAASVPFYISDDNEVIEKYMGLSNETVSERAKQVATYTVERMWGMNWETKVTREVEDWRTSGKSQEILN